LAELLKDDHEQHVEEEKCEGSAARREVEVAAKKVRARGAERPRVSNHEDMEGYPQREAPGRRWRKVKRGRLTIEEKIQIVHEVVVLHEKQTVVAYRHRISNATVSSLYKRAQRNKEFFEEMLSQRAGKELKVETVKQKVVAMNESRKFIDSAAMVKRHLEADEEHLEEMNRKKFKEHEICEVMRRELGMSFRKVTHVAVHANSEKNLVLRQLFAIKLLSILQSKAVIINVDETWLGMADFRRMKWRKMNDTNSIPLLQMQPRISMILGLDTRG
jgi:hypothetical protein